MKNYDHLNNAKKAYDKIQHVSIIKKLSKFFALLCKLHFSFLVSPYISFNYSFLVSGHLLCKHQFALEMSYEKLSTDH
jgi:hypothetical protein